MEDILHHIGINATPRSVYKALTTEEGIKHWWTEDCSITSLVGSIAEFRFHEYDRILRMRIDESRPSERLCWTCIGGSKDWERTTLTFELAQNGPDGTTVIFRHSGCGLSKERVAGYNKYWSAALVRLKAYAEGSCIGPLHGK